MKRQSAFTLVELVVVIMILGILAGVAAPKLLNTSGTATDNGVRQTLAVVRNAIELYAAENSGTLPPCTGDGTNFRTALEPYLRGNFPVCPVGPAQDSDITPTSGATTTANNTTGWMFNTTDGTFIVNASTNDNSQPPVAYSTY